MVIVQGAYFRGGGAYFPDYIIYFLFPAKAGASLVPLSAADLLTELTPDIALCLLGES